MNLPLKFISQFFVSNRKLRLILQTFFLVFLTISLTQAQKLKTVTNMEDSELYPIVQNGKFGFINNKGQVIIEPKYVIAEPFAEGLALVVISKDEEKEVCAYIDKTGEYVIEPFEGSGSRFSSGVAKVLRGANYNYIDKTGKWISDFYRSAEDCTEGLCAVRMNPLGGRHWGYINTSGAVVIKGQYDWAQPFTEGIARVGLMTGEPYLKDGMIALTRKEGYLDKAGKAITPLKFDKAWDFSNGMAQVLLNGRWGYIDLTGQIVIAPQYDETRAFREGVAGIKINGFWGYINKKGKIVIAPQFESAEDFYEGWAVVKKNDKSLYIDKAGQTMLSVPFTFAEKFRNGIATVGFYGKGGAIDKTGKIVVEPRFASIVAVSDYMIYVQDNDKGYGYLDHTGRFVWGPTY